MPDNVLKLIFDKTKPVIDKDISSTSSHLIRLQYEKDRDNILTEEAKRHEDGYKEHEIKGLGSSLKSLISTKKEDEQSVSKRLLKLAQEADYKYDFWKASETALSMLKLMETECPNFSEALQDMQDEIILRKVTQVQPRPKLFVGSPGAGKSHFVRLMSENLKLPFFMMNLSREDGPFNLIGVNSTYVTARPSLLLEKAISGNATSGIAFFDELTAVKTDTNRNFPTLPSLLSFLETEESRSFKDNYTNIEADYSKWFKFAACNDLDGLSSALLDRFDVYNVKPLSIAQRVSILTMEAFSFYGIEFTEEAIDELARSTLSMRSVKSVQRKAVAKAVREGRDTIRKRDLERFDLKRSL